MRDTTIKLFAALLTILGGAMCAAATPGKPINAATQIDWTKVSGTTAPSGGACTSTFYGMPYTNNTNGNFYVCAASGWVLVAGGGGGITGSGTTGFFVVFTGSTAVGNSPIDYGVTTASTVTSSEKFVVNCTTCPTQVDLPYNSGHALVPAASAAGIGADSSNNLIGYDNGGTAARICTATNGVCAAGGTTTIASGTSAMGTGAISSGTCATVVTATATGVATTDIIIYTPNADPTAITGYSPSSTGSLYIWAYPTTNNVNFRVCNNTSGSITPSALTLNWRVVR